MGPKVQAEMHRGKSTLVLLTAITSGDSLTQARSSRKSLALTVTEAEPG